MRTIQEKIVSMILLDPDYFDFFFRAGIRSSDFVNPDDKVLKVIYNAFEQAAQKEKFYQLDLIIVCNILINLGLVKSMAEAKEVISRLMAHAGS